jgi:hypothetical protein
MFFFFELKRYIRECKKRGSILPSISVFPRSLTSVKTQSLSSTGPITAPSRIFSLSVLDSLPPLPKLCSLHPVTFITPQPFLTPESEITTDSKIISVTQESSSISK